MHATKGSSSGRFRKALARRLKASAGSLVLATAVMTTPPAEAATAPTDGAPALDERARKVRSQLADETPAPDRSAESGTRFAWWGNWHNWGYHPGWHNWPNWRNWHNWHNWGNW